MAASNYDDVIDQLRAAGLVVDELRIGTHKPVRCKVEGDREKRGWYILHELNTARGDVLIVGSFGVWHGDEKNTQKIELRKREISAEERDALKRRLADDRRRARQVREAEAARAADRAAKAWAKCEPTGESEYLARKGVLPLGVRFSPSGALVVPMMDATGQIHGLQVIRSAKAARAERRLEKEYWPAGLEKKGRFHLVGMPTKLVLVAEGYATAASLHAATQLPVAVAFDAGNIAPVALELKKRYRGARILICADDDRFKQCRACDKRFVLAGPTCTHCGAEHRHENAGVAAASRAALEVGGMCAWVVPTWRDEDARVARYLEHGAKLTDFNDLHLTESLTAVTQRIQGRLSELKWDRLAAPAAGTTTGGGGGRAALKPIDTLDELLERYVLVYGQGGTVFDRQEHCLLSISDMRDACIRRDIHRAWAEHPAREIVRVRQVGFDPSNEDPEVTCNLWAGWPTEPRAGECARLLELLRYMCSEDLDANGLYDWVLRWIAYPIQNPGAKMKTTLVIHGPQGTGKNLFFEALMSIYGHYGRVIDQSAIEDRFNDWASRKLFLIADEVVARSDLYHVKNKLKAFITGEWIRINPKNLAAYDERNHVNVVFLSNEAMPVVLEEDDRRHAVIWTPKKLEPAFYAGVLRELANGGAAALHDYLLHLDLGDFGPGELPPTTTAKLELVDLSLDSTSRFFYALIEGDVGGIEPRPALSEDVYELYKGWCHRTGARAAPLPRLVNALKRKHGVETVRRRYLTAAGMKGPHGIVLLGRGAPPEGTSESTWLGEQITAFRGAVADMRGSSGP